MNLEELKNLLDTITEENKARLEECITAADEIFLIGNGGSNAIASHMAVDYTKFLGKRCYVPNASDLMTMIVNDYGKEEMYSKFINYNYNSSAKQLAILISSSGNSINIYNAAKRCDELSIPMVLLSGFDMDNKLNNFKSDSIKIKNWWNSNSYGTVEMIHHIYLHSII